MSFFKSPTVSSGLHFTRTEREEEKRELLESHLQLLGKEDRQIHLSVRGGH